MERVIYLLIAIILAGGSYHFWDKSDQLERDNNLIKEKLSNEIEKHKIKISKTNLSQVTKFTFLEVTNEFQYLYEKTLGKWLTKDKVGVLYQWDYTFSFGFDLTKEPNWNWCPTLISNEPGVIQVNAPGIVQTNVNSPSPKPVRVFNDAYWDEHQVRISNEVNEHANEKVKEVASIYLKNPTTISSVTKALGAHLQQVMNSAYEDSNPIREVRVVFSDICKPTEK